MVVYNRFLSGLVNYGMFTKYLYFLYLASYLDFFKYLSSVYDQVAPDRCLS